MSRRCWCVGSKILPRLYGARGCLPARSRISTEETKDIEAWRSRPIEGEFPYLFLDGIVLKRTWAGEVRNVSVLTAIGVGADGYRRVLGIVEGARVLESG
ncbi:transposase [Pelomicrobium sp. G1]|uniref:transposase n=1 Tax=Pelomicrobium sp. G1 TaxID=3452920 RepID=UPI003F775BC7